MKKFECRYKEQTRIVGGCRTKNEAAEISWIELGAPDPFCVDVHELPQLPPLSDDVCDMDDGPTHKGMLPW